MSDRLQDLRRQRALQREHLDWIDREIAALEAEAQGSSVRSPPPLSRAAGTPVGGAEAILEEYRTPPAYIERRTKLGCLVYFGVAVALLGLAVTAIFLLERARRPH